ncbi:hypothetical protein [Liquorilactobacillus sicerae]|uniref:hypothetical protein n=1 Tax=Liquorilactobacillus sicerae TaxID=1416943 RepID=UPI00248187C8|nr:hypothetical protein [Liquorilactobacillus sicerae]
MMWRFCSNYGFMGSSFWLTITALLVFVVIFSSLVFGLTRKTSSAKKVLDEKYASGEIDWETYQTRCHNLRN